MTWASESTNVQGGDDADSGGSVAMMGCPLGLQGRKYQLLDPYCQSSNHFIKAKSRERHRMILMETQGCFASS